MNKLKPIYDSIIRQALNVSTFTRNVSLDLIYIRWFLVVDALGSSTQNLFPGLLPSQRRRGKCAYVGFCPQGDALGLDVLGRPEHSSSHKTNGCHMWGTRGRKFHLLFLKTGQLCWANCNVYSRTLTLPNRSGQI